MHWGRVRASFAHARTPNGRLNLSTTFPTLARSLPSPGVLSRAGRLLRMREPTRNGGALSPSRLAGGNAIAALTTARSRPRQPQLRSAPCSGPHPRESFGVQNWSLAPTHLLPLAEKIVRGPGC
ncbi:hypothetical protein FKM82_030445 [Ascaphus truei]